MGGRDAGLLEVLDEFQSVEGDAAHELGPVVALTLLVTLRDAAANGVRRSAGPKAKAMRRGLQAIPQGSKRSVARSSAVPACCRDSPYKGSAHETVKIAR